MTILKETTELGDRWYRQAESKAGLYLAALQDQIRSKSYVSALFEDLTEWRSKHLPRRSLHSLWRRGAKPPDASEGSPYLAWLARTGKLEDYLERSVSYMYLRDLGQDLSDPRTRMKIQHLVAEIKRWMDQPAGTPNGALASEVMISPASVYRWAQREGVEEAAIWVMGRLKRARSHLPPEMDAEEAERKLIKVILGVVMHVLDEMDGETNSTERSRRLGEAMKIGYYYGLTYPYIDDLLDSGVLNAEEQEQYIRMIRMTVRTGIVPDMGEWSGRHPERVRFIQAELREAYEFIRGYQNPETQDLFFEQSYLFFESQDADRQKTLDHGHYSNEELYLPIILKSASSRLMVRSVISAPQDEEVDQRVFYYGLYNQLADDFADMDADREAGAVTPYTYYLTYRHERPDLINPFELYWAVVSHLIHHVYRSEPQTRELILTRAINGLKRNRRRVGAERFHEVMTIFSLGSPALEELIQLLVLRAVDVDFYDKWLRDQMLAKMRTNRQEKEEFIQLVQNARRYMNTLLPISTAAMPPIKENPLLVDAANYSLEGSGKRLRPILAWVMGVQVYGLDQNALSPLFRALEYMHTASLIFDDLPSQDNAATRRGRPTLHELHGSAIAELTGIFLIQKATLEQASLQAFDSSSVLALLQYLSRKAAEICIGQAMDLNAKGKVLSREELDQVCFYKTGIAFEACLVAPAILARVPETEIAILKKIAYHTGIAFQIKDDLLDEEGDPSLLGKPAGKDAENASSTYVTVLGPNAASQAMWEHYCLAMEALLELPRPPVFLKHLLNSMIDRNH
ncbi:polyprenyl synthetase family protein [Paenibacillus phocaensis]|uniref:polyprenyl synthetase family protein n=1 Tax=Paenibacillus phocaensis TaxID=1776378 RepID=UPI000839B44B|nr:polyprenyl synthetase family protein [Paenibacillus phocaensis]